MFAASVSCENHLSKEEMSTFYQLRETALFSALRRCVYQEFYGTGRNYFAHKGMLHSPVWEKFSMTLGDQWFSLKRESENKGDCSEVNVAK